MSAEKMFPIMRRDGDQKCPKFIPWRLLKEEWAQRNHSQSLSRLAERGGLDPCEAVANILGTRWSDIDTRGYDTCVDYLIAACNAPIRSAGSGSGYLEG